LTWFSSSVHRNGEHKYPVCLTKELTYKITALKSGVGVSFVRAVIGPVVADWDPDSPRPVSDRLSSSRSTTTRLSRLRPTDVPLVFLVIHPRDAEAGLVGVKTRVDG
jgi:hypothetical protein